MVKLRKGNVILRVDDDAPIDKYLAKGYSVIGANGEVIKQAFPTDSEELRQMVVKLETELSIAKKEIEKLKAEKQASKKSTKSKKAE